MVRVWNRLVVTAMIMLGLAPSAFSMLIVVKPRNYGDLGWPVASIIVFGVATPHMVARRLSHAGVASVDDYWLKILNCGGYLLAGRPCSGEPPPPGPRLIHDRPASAHSRRTHPETRLRTRIQRP